MQEPAQDSTDDATSVTPFYPFGVLGRGYLVPAERDRGTIQGIVFCHATAALVLAILTDQPELDSPVMAVMVVLVALSAIGTIVCFLKWKGARSVSRSLAGAWRSQVAYSKARPIERWLLLCGVVVLLGVLMRQASVAGTSLPMIAYGFVALGAISIDLVPYFAYGRTQPRTSEST